MAATNNREDTIMAAKNTRNETAELVNRVKSHLETYVAFANEAHSTVLALWTLHTYGFDAFDVTPYMYISSVDPGAGKTTLMETVGDVARNPQKSDNLTSAVMFRMIDAMRPTFIIDEVDTIYSGSKNEELRSVLNGGYSYNGRAQRIVEGEPMDFSTFCPKMIGGIDNGQLPATILDRSIRIRLRKLSGDKLAEKGIQRRNIRKLRRDESLNQLRKDLAAWGSVETADRLADIEPPVIPGIDARQWDIAEPLMQVAHLAGMHKEAREAIIALFQGEKVETPETRALAIAREAFEDTDADRITTNTLAERCGMTPNRLSRLLSPMGIESRPVKVAGKAMRGYYRSEFEAAWERYL